MKCHGISMQAGLEIVDPVISLLRLARPALSLSLSSFEAVGFRSRHVKNETIDKMSPGVAIRNEQRIAISIAIIQGREIIDYAKSR